MKKSLVLLLSLALLMGVTIPAIAQPPGLIIDDRGASAETDWIGTVYITPPAGKPVAVVKYLDTEKSGDLTYDSGPGLRIVIYDTILSITNPRGSNFMVPVAPRVIIIKS